MLLSGGTDHCKAVTAATYCGWNGIDKTQCEERKGCCYNGSHCLYPAGNFDILNLPLVFILYSSPKKMFVHF